MSFGQGATCRIRQSADISSRPVDATVISGELAAESGPHKQPHRRESRLRTGRAIRIDVLGLDGTDELVHVLQLNCSTRGIGMISPHAVMPGSRFSIRLFKGRKRAAVLYQVRYCDPLGDGTYRVGGEAIGVIGTGLADRPEKLLLMLMTAQTPGAKGSLPGEDAPPRRAA
jgi:hypothetical protein